jgi:S-adenosylmethionine hydrolase
MKRPTARKLALSTLILLSTGLMACTSARKALEPTWFPANVVRISKEYANINTDLTAPQLAEHGIAHGTTFDVKFGDRQMKALLGKKYSDVDKGKWIALIEEDGKLQLAISFGHAATDISCKEGDTLYIQSLTQKK